MPLEHRVEVWVADRDRLLAAVAAALPGATIEEVVSLLLTPDPQAASAKVDQARVVRDLGERVKELTALHQVASLLQNEALPEDEVLSRVSAVLPPAFLYPQDAVGRVIYGTSVHATPGFASTAWLLRSPFRTSEGREGAIEVAYLHEHPAEVEGPFLAEERRLLDSLAEMIAAALDRQRAAERLRLLMRTGRVRLVEWDVLADRFSWPGIPDSGTPRGARAMTRAEIFQNIHPEDQPILARTMDEVMSNTPGHVEFAVEYRAAFTPGDYRWRHVTGRVIRDGSGRSIRVIAISADITEQRTLQDRLRQGQKMEALGRLAGGVAHDFNNILTVILGYSQLCELEMGAGDPMRTNVREITKAGETAAALVKQILAFARRQELRPAKVDLRTLVAESEGLIGRLLGKRVQLQHEFAADAPLALVDPHQFQQVILNLSVNARDAMSQGGKITLRVRKETRGQPQQDGTAGAPRDWATLEVQDTGCGMPPEVRERMFEPFFTTKEAGKGTGLGLSTVHGIVSQSGGFLDVESEVGRGTVIRAHFPVPSDL